MLGLLAMSAAIAYLLRRYAAPSVPLIVLAATAYAWAVSMSIVLITPLDVAATLAHEPEPAISTLWKITYWSTQVGLCVCWGGLVWADGVCGGGGQWSGAGQCCCEGQQGLSGGGCPLGVTPCVRTHSGLAHACRDNPPHVCQSL